MQNNSSLRLALGGAMALLIISGVWWSWQSLQSNSATATTRPNLPPQPTRPPVQKGAESESEPSAWHPLSAANSSIQTTLEQRLNLTALGAQTAAADLDQAFAKLATLTEKADYSAFLRGMFETVARTSTPDTALAAVRRLEAKDKRGIATLTLLRLWSGSTDEELVTKFGGSIQGFGEAGALGIFLAKKTGSGFTPEMARSMSDEVPGTWQKTEFLTQSAVALAARDPDAALALGDGLTGGAQRHFQRNFAQALAKDDLSSALSWAKAQGENSGELLASLIPKQAETDTDGALRTLAEIKDPRAAARATEQLAASFASKDTAAAMQWMESLQDPEQRKAAERGIQRAAPVGVGISIDASNPLGLQITSLVDNSPASRSGALRQGDLITAIADGNGQWVSAQSIELGRATSLIRGKAGTSVQIQVLPANAAPGTQPRVVTLPREQIFNRRR